MLYLYPAVALRRRRTTTSTSTTSTTSTTTTTTNTTTTNCHHLHHQPHIHALLSSLARQFFFVSSTSTSSSSHSPPPSPFCKPSSARPPPFTPLPASLPPPFLPTLDLPSPSTFHRPSAASATCLPPQFHRFLLASSLQGEVNARLRLITNRTICARVGSPRTTLASLGRRRTVQA